MLPYPINVSMWVFISVLLDIVLSIDCCYYQLLLMNCCVGLLSVSKCLLFQAYNFEWFWTHCGWLKHVCVGNLTIIGSDNGLAPTCSRQLAIIWTKCWNIVNWTLGNKLQGNFYQNKTFSFRKCIWKRFFVCKMAAICLSLKVTPFTPWAVLSDDYCCHVFACESVCFSITM